MDRAASAAPNDESCMSMGRKAFPGISRFGQEIGSFSRS